MGRGMSGPERGANTGIHLVDKWRCCPRVVGCVLGQYTHLLNHSSSSHSCCLGSVSLLPVRILLITVLIRVFKSVLLKFNGSVIAKLFQNNTPNSWQNLEFVLTWSLQSFLAFYYTTNHHFVCFVCLMWTWVWYTTETKSLRFSIAVNMLISVSRLGIFNKR